MPNIYILFASQELIISIPQSSIFNLTKVKKKILKKFGFYPSDHSFINLFFLQLYVNQPPNIKTPAFNHENFDLLMKFLLQNSRPIRIQVESTQKLNEKQKKKISKNQVEFDENGSQISNEELAILTPTKPYKYQGNEIVRCAFCKKSSKDKKALVNCGGLYGPFLQNKYVHLLCAIWCSGVYLNEEGELMDVEKEVKAAQNYRCYYCKKKGAGLCCHNDLCNRTIHFECGKKDDRCFFNWQKYQFWCQKCKYEVEDDVIYDCDMDIEQ